MAYQKKISPLTKSLLTGLIVFFTGVLSATAQPTPDANGIIYVRQGGSGNGSSWASPTGSLQGAIDAPGVTQVWVAKGTYQPASGQSFIMKHGVAIYGGFPNNNIHADMTHRNWANHLTTLQGNGSSVVKNDGNALTATDILDGFTIKGGSGDYGGGILNIASSPSYTNLVITGNNVNWYGGGMLIAGAPAAPRITNVLISNNSAGYGGGVNNSSSPVFTNVTISGNTAYGGSEWNEGGTAAIRNSVIYGNGVNGQLNDVQNSLVQNQTNAAYTNAANHNLPTDTDPLFTDPDAGNYSPLYESPVINKGKNTLFDGLGADTKDLVGNARLFDTTVDMGAYECQILQPVPDANGIVYIRQGGTGDGSSWANATGYLQRAISVAGVTQVWVAKGTYQPRSGQSFTMRQGVAIYGGFPDNDDNADMDDRDWSTHVATLKGNGSSVIKNEDNALTAADILDGFTITGGATFQYGGGIYNYNSSPVYTNLVITANSAYVGGGIAIYEGAAPHLINVRISGNTAASGGGGVNASSPLLTNVTISGNFASIVGGGGEWVDIFGTAVIRNSIIYGGGVGGDPMIDIQNSLVQNQTDAAYTDAAHHNLPTGTDPLFTNPALGMYTLQPSSPAVNRGSNAFFAGLNAHTKDLAGNPRVFDFSNSGAVDMGAYESQVVPPEPVIRVVYVRQGGTGDGSSWAQAMGDFQGAIDVADVEQVWVAQGTYQPVSGRPFIMKRGVAIYGGFPKDNDHAGMDDRDWATHPTTLQGNEKCVIENENNALTPADILDGFIITGGKASYGAGIMNFNSSPSYVNLVITGNEATLIAGGIMIGLAAPRLTNVLISGNTAFAAGGVAVSGSSPVFTNVTVSGNTASEEGAGEWFDETGTSVIRNSIIYGNGVEGQMENIQNSLIQNQTNAAYGDVANNNLPTNTDPLFTNPAGGEYTLKPGSPVINNGSNAFFEGLNANTQDLAGNPRLVGATVDMGAFESADGTLPVRWISFEGRLNEQRQAVLTWKTEETNVSHYEIERSANAKDFHVTGTVIAGGTGSGRYSHTDPDPVSGRVYYRIRQVDRDGTFSYSRIISIAGEGRAELFAYPNPARDRIAIELGPEYTGSKARLLNLAGVILQQVDVKQEKLTLDISSYASGIYLLQLHDGRLIKLVKE